MKRRIPVSAWAKQELMTQLYNPAEQYLKARLSYIIHDNNMLYGNKDTLGDVIYLGKRYTNCDGTFGRDTFYKGYLLHDSLKEVMDKWLVDAEEVEQEKKTIERYLSRLFANIKNSDDIKNILGDNLFALIEEFKSMWKYPETKASKLKQWVNNSVPYVETMQNRMIDNMISKTLYERT